MITSAVLSALLSTSAQADAGTHKLAKPKVATRSLEACGFPEVNARLDDTLHEDVLDISAIQNATDDQLSCVANVSVETSYYVVVSEPGQARYARISAKAINDKGLRDAKAWLAKLGLLARLPAYSARNYTQFAQSVEDLCDTEGATKAKLRHGASSNGQFDLEAVRSRLSRSAFECFVNVLIASGLQIGFVGNELYQAANSPDK